MQLNAMRRLTVGRVADVASTASNASSLRLIGQWLHDLGFTVGEQVIVECRDGNLVIRRAETAATAWTHNLREREAWPGGHE